MTLPFNPKIDLAVLGKKLFAVSPIATGSHIINLYTHTLPVQDFYNTFFDGTIFTIQYPIDNANLEYIKIDNALLEDGINRLNLYDKVLEYAAEDLQITQASFTSVSKIELTKECKNLTLSSLTIASALTWSDIVDKLLTIPPTPIVINAVLSNNNPCINNIICRFTFVCTE
jgi:hypothetical protein